MNQKELKKYKGLLNKKKKELTPPLHDMEAIRIEKIADPMDAILEVGTREMAIRDLDRNSRILRAIEIALQKMEAKTYGVCVTCQQDISPNRLDALPWAPRCISCQESKDEEDQENCHAPGCFMPFTGTPAY